MGKNLFYKRDVCTGDPRAHFLQFQEGFNVDHVYIIERGRSVSVRIGFEGYTVYYSLVKDEPVSFYELTDVDFFGVGVAFEDLTRNMDVASSRLEGPGSRRGDYHA